MSFVERILSTWLSILNDTSVWLIISFILAGLLHIILKPDRFQQVLGNRKISSLVKATVSGMLLPVCSCGVIPLGIGMYYLGAFLGPTLAFMTATPIINPVAMLLAYGLLGPKIATIYLITGFIAPMITGIAANLFAASEIHAPHISPQNSRAVPIPAESLSLKQKILSGLHWGFMDLGVMVSKYVVIGILLAGLIIAVLPSEIIQRYLGDPGMVSIGGIAVLGAVMYVCAVGHIPLVAALVASGAAPGVALTFLMTGAATNLPELVSIAKTIGKRAVIIYTTSVVLCSLLAGYLTNRLLMPGFTPLFNLDGSRYALGLARHLIIAVPEFIQLICTGIVILLCFFALCPRLRVHITSWGISK